MNVNSSWIATARLCVTCAVALMSIQLVAEVTQRIISRYGSSLDWGQINLQDAATRRYWRTKKEWAESLVIGVPVLSGLSIALDPGHLGGEWAESEGRCFRMSDDDHWVREGELVLEIARRIAAKLEPLGAEVTLLRESSTPLNSKLPEGYLPELLTQYPMSKFSSLAEQADYALMLQERAVKLAIVSGELAARARRVNSEVQPDIAISLHINAAPWQLSDEGKRLLSDQNHLHVLIFGAMSPTEIESSQQRRQLHLKLANGSGAEELALGSALAASLAEATQLPPSVYRGDHAVMCDPEEPYVWARNLHILRAVDCPIVMLEPYIANSKVGYARIQEALGARAAGQTQAEDDILIEYANAVVAGILSRYAAEAD